MKRWLRWAIIGLLLAFWAWYLWQNASLLFTSEWSFDLPLFLAALALGTTAYGFYGWGWMAAFRAVGGTIGAGTGLRRWYQSLIMKYTPGGVWHIAGRAYLLHGDRQSVSLALVSAVLEQGLIANAALLVGGAGLLATPVPQVLDMPWLEPVSRLVGLAALIGGVAAIHPRVFHFWTRLASWPITLIAARTPAVKAEGVRYSDVFDRTIGGLRYRQLAALQLWFVLGIGCGAISTMLCGIALGADPSIMFAASWAVFAFAWLAGFVIIFTPGGLGARELVMTAMLDPLIGPALALATALLSRIAYTGGEVIAVAAGSLLLRARHLPLAPPPEALADLAPEPAAADKP